MNNHDEAIQNTVNKWIKHVLDITDSEIKFEKCTLDETMDKYFHDLIAILLDTDKDDVEKAFIPVIDDKDYICVTSYIDVSDRKHIVINTNSDLVVDVYVDRLKLNTVIYGIDNGEAPFPKLVDDVLNYIVYGKDSDTISEIIESAMVLHEELSDEEVIRELYDKVEVLLNAVDSIRLRLDEIDDKIESILSR